MPLNALHECGTRSSVLLSSIRQLLRPIPELAAFLWWGVSSGSWFWMAGLCSMLVFCRVLWAPCVCRVVFSVFLWGFSTGSIRVLVPLGTECSTSPVICHSCGGVGPGVGGRSVVTSTQGWAAVAG